MTRLKELQLHGFKTFADPTRFVFERGVTAVIGPNGSGKSNMADAVRWVLGEQSNRSLRTRRADDVIFAGSQARRPQGMAEAVLTLDNSDRWLPIDFGEVSIGRRAYRSGETEYLINGTRVRLKDVVDLLAGGRLGANELIVVGQGTVDAALSLRPEERRQLFEEAAGVKNLQVRKNEALGRLARARENLTRVADLIGELKPQVRRLALQAQHQQEHDALGQRARALVGEVHRRREVTARGSLGEARRRMAAAESALEALRAEETAGREAIQAAESRYWTAEAEARSAAERREASREALIRAEAAADSAARRHADLVNAIARAQADLATVAEELDANQELDDPDAALKWQAASDAEQAWRSAVAELEQVDRQVIASDAALSAARARASAWIGEAARVDEAAARASARAERIELELLAAGTAAVEAAAATGAARNAVSDAEGLETDAGVRLTAARAQAEDSERQADEDRARATVLAERIGGLRAELDTLRERAEGGGGLATILASAGWQALLPAIDPPAAAWTAIETLVGGELEQALVWRDGDVLDHAAEARGTAHLLADRPPDDRVAETDARTAACAAVGATRTVAEWIGSERGPRLFAHAVVAPDLAALLNGWRALPTGWSAVTEEGDLADGRGLVVVRGRQEGSAGAAARQHARRGELAAIIEELESEHRAAGEAAGQALVAAAAARHAREDASAVRDEAEEGAALARGALARANEAVARGRALEQGLRAELDDVQTSAAHGGSPAKPSPIASELELLATTVAEAYERRAELAGERDRRRSAWQLAQSVADATDSGLGSARYERAVLAARRDQLTAGLQADREALTTVEAEQAGMAGAIAAVMAADDQAARERAAADTDRDRLRAELLEHERARGGTTSQLAELEHQVQVAAIEGQRLDDELVAVGRERDLAIESLPVAMAVPVTGSAEDPAAADLAAVNLDTMEAELARVRRTLAQIGSVNPFAVEEHRELAERLDTLAGQDGDLNAAITSTEQLISRLEAQIAAQFNSAFVAIGAKFDEFCRLLFAGGSASLQMSEAGDDEGAGGIEIAVRPPGKRTQRLAMLSGGERALAGVALLFAMLSVNPVPFCILDEVDAALDEANIGRFADALRQLAQQIDFVVITHNRATIETADTIYGVTMTDAAVSRLLSLRLADLPVGVVAG